MGDFHPFTDVGEHRGVLADDVAGANGGKADAFRIAFAGMAFARIDRTAFQIAPQRAGDRFAHGQRRARRRIHFVAMVRLNDFDIGIVAHHLRGLLKQFQHQVDADAEVGGEHDADMLRRIADRLLAGVIKAGGTNHHRLMVRHAKFQVAQGAFRAGEVDQNVELARHVIQTVAHLDAQRADARQLAGVDADQA